MKSARISLGLVISLCGAIVLFWGSWTPAKKMHILNFLPETMVVQNLQGAKAALLEHRVMMLSYPNWQRLGDPAQIRLTFEAQPVSEYPDDLVDVSRTYDVFVEASLDMPDLEADPKLTAGQVLPKGRTVTFWWTATGGNAGHFEGTVWLRLRFEPHAGGNEETTTLAAPRIEVEVRRLLFLSGSAARWLGGLGLVSGVFISIYFWRKSDA